MGIFRATVHVKRTIWPYKDGWGVVIKRPFEPDTVTDTGLSKKVAEEVAKETRQMLRGE